MSQHVARFFEIVLADLPVGVQVWQMKPAFSPERSRLIFVNTLAAELVDRPPESSLGRTIEELFPEFCTQGLPACMARVFEDRTTIRFGELRWGAARFVAHVFRLPNRRVGLTLQPAADLDPAPTTP